MNLLFCSVGRRGELIKNFKNSMGNNGKIIAVDGSNVAPAMYLADKQYVVPSITDEMYIPTLMKICKEEKIDAIATFIDPEIEILSANRELFESIGVKTLVPYLETAKLCFDKYEMYKHLRKNNIPTVLTFGDMDEFNIAFGNKEIDFPVFVKPRTGSGSVGARRVNSYEELKLAMNESPELIIQELMTGIDMDADVYIDIISKKVVSAFSKKKLATRIGGASKTISFKDNRLFETIEKVADVLELYGPNDMDFFYKDGQYYLSEINPRFGGAYLHAYGAGVDFVKLIENNIKGIENTKSFGDYEEDVIMMMYDSVVIRKKEDLAENFNM